MIKIFIFDIIRIKCYVSSEQGSTFATFSPVSTRFYIPLHSSLHLSVSETPTLMARRKRRRNKGSVHPILCTAYGDRARNLKDTVLSLLPPPPPPDSCHSGCFGCLRCRGADYLLCQDDPTTYRHLMTYAQCALSSDAPVPPVINSVRQLSQRQVAIGGSLCTCFAVFLVLWLSFWFLY